MANAVAARIPEPPRPVVRRFAADAGGATSIEYALIAGLIFVVICGSLRLYASRVSDVYQRIGNTISQN